MVKSSFLRFLQGSETPAPPLEEPVVLAAPFSYTWLCR